MARTIKLLTRFWLVTLLLIRLSEILSTRRREGVVEMEGVTVVHGVNQADLDSHLCPLPFALVTMYVTHTHGFRTLASAFVQMGMDVSVRQGCWGAYTAGVQSW